LHVEGQVTLTRSQAIFACLHALIVAIVCAGLVIAAALVPAPPVVVPFVAVVSIAMPMIATIELPSALSTLREHRRATAALRRALDRLPETRHPLGR
jgi:uncharacterized membrane protein AbrB (regulator of aidB expression)